MANGLDAFQGLPLWVRIIAVVGFPTTIACVLLAVFLGWFESPLTKVVQQQSQQIQLLTQVLQTAQLNRQEERATFEYQNLLLRTLCRTYAKPELQLQCEPRYRGFEEPPTK
jgi:hypothetical protein